MVARRQVSINRRHRPVAPTNLATDAPVNANLPAGVPDAAPPPRRRGRPRVVAPALAVVPDAPLQPENQPDILPADVPDAAPPPRRRGRPRVVAPALAVVPDAPLQPENQPDILPADVPDAAPPPRRTRRERVTRATTVAPEAPIEGRRQRNLPRHLRPDGDTPLEPRIIELLCLFMEYLN